MYLYVRLCRAQDLIGEIAMGKTARPCSKITPDLPVVVKALHPQTALNLQAGTGCGEEPVFVNNTTGLRF